MTVTFRKLEIHNFMSYEDEVFEFDTQKGMNLICGINNDIPGSKNACGKSSLCHALVYAIYGQLPFKLKNENIINRYVNSREMYVSITFSTEKRKYKIVSGLKNRQSFCYLYDISRGEEKNISKSTITETRNFITNEILKCDLPLFMRTIMLNSDPSYNFYNLSRADKTEFINKLFNISIYGDMYEKAHSEKLKLEKEITSKNSVLMVYLKNKEDYERGRIEFEENNKNEVEKLTEDLDKHTEDLKKLESESVERNDKNIDKCREIRNKVNDYISNNNAEIKSGTSAIRMLKSNISSVESQIGKFSDIIGKHKIVQDKLCPDCKDIFAKHYKIDKYTSEIEKLSEKISLDKKKIDEISSDIIKRESDINSSRKNIIKIDNKIKELSEGYETYRENHRKLTSTINNIVEKIKELKEERNPYGKLDEENNKNIEETRTELQNLNNTYEIVKISENIIKPDTVKKLVIGDMIGELNNSIMHYLHKMGANYDVRFNEDMDYEFITKSDKNPEFHNFSSGEQMRISIATCFAFRDFLSRRSNINSNILILDEFIDSNIDTMAIDSILDILNEFSTLKRQNVFIISHRNEVKDDNKFRQIIQIEKNSNISTIKYLPK